MSRTCLDVKKLSAWIKKSWTSSGLATSRGSASKICVAPRTFNPHGSSLRYNKCNMLFSATSCTTIRPPWHLSQHGRSLCSVAGSSWDGPRLMRRKTTAHYLEARLDLFWAEDWPALWAMGRAECDVAPVHSTTRRTTTEQKQSRMRKVATPARSGEKGRALAVVRNAPPVPVTEQIVERSRVSILQTRNLPLLPSHLCQTFACQKLLSSFLPHFARCPDSVNLDRSACVRPA